MQLELERVKSTEKTLEREFKKKEKIEENDLQSLFFAFLNRARFKYTVQNILELMFKCFCIRSLDDNRHVTPYKNHFLFSKAKDKFMQELDVVRIVKTLRKFKMLAQALLS